MGRGIEKPLSEQQGEDGSYTKDLASRMTFDIIYLSQNLFLFDLYGIRTSTRTSPMDQPPQPSPKFSLCIWLVKRILSGHRNPVKLQTLPFSHGEPHPAAVRSWGLVKLLPTIQGRVNSPPA